MNTQKKKYILILMCVVLIFMGIVFYINFVKVTQVFSEETYELGDVKISTDLKTYISASKFLCDKAILDVSSIDENRVGDYVITCTVGKKVLTYDVHIVDTTSPKIEFGDIAKVFGEYNEYSIDDLNITVTDLSEITDFDVVSCKKGDNILKINNNSFTFEDIGAYTIEIKVSDCYGNSTTNMITVDVVEAPQYVLLENRRYKIGTQYLPSDFVFANDRNGNDISKNVKVLNDSNFDSNIEGNYEITFRVTDNDGIYRDRKINIEIGDFENNDYGFELNEETMNILIGHKLFQYEPLTDNESNDFDKIIEITSPASFGIHCESENGKSWVNFCGFIYKITPKYVYFFTNKHCEFKYENINIIDCNNNVTKIPKDSITTIKYHPEFAALGNGYKQYDIQMFVVPIECFKRDNFLTYKEVYIDWNIYNTIKIGDRYLMNAQAWKNATNDILRTTSIRFLDGYNQAYSQISYKNGVLYNYIMDESHMLLGEEYISVSGCSGAPCFDKYGNLIGINHGSMIKNLEREKIHAVVKLEDFHNFVDTLEFK